LLGIRIFIGRKQNIHFTLLVSKIPNRRRKAEIITAKI